MGKARGLSCGDLQQILDQRAVAMSKTKAKTNVNAKGRPKKSRRRLHDPTVDEEFLYDLVTPSLGRCYVINGC